MSGRFTSSKNLVWIGERCWSFQLLSADVSIDVLPLSQLGFIGRSYALAGCGHRCTTLIPQGNGFSSRHRDQDRVVRATVLVCMDSGRLSWTLFYVRRGPVSKPRMVSALKLTPPRQHWLVSEPTPTEKVLKMSRSTYFPLVESLFIAWSSWRRAACIPLRFPNGVRVTTQQANASFPQLVFSLEPVWSEHQAFKNDVSFDDGDAVIRAEATWNAT